MDFWELLDFWVLWEFWECLVFEEMCICGYFVIFSILGILGKLWNLGIFGNFGIFGNLGNLAFLAWDVCRLASIAVLPQDPPGLASSCKAEYRNRNQHVASLLQGVQQACACKAHNQYC